ncbi:MAG TPA: sigma 54-interacting transcriptional regulator, partial [Polyangiaceae bacterium]|nr:sigma 54-interacting transcriptional regulator [Polyangiaceae bacterium]
IPLIVLTGSVGEEQAVQCMHLGAADYLLKNRLSRLGPAVHRALQEKRARDAKHSAEQEARERRNFEESLTALSTKLTHASSDQLEQALTHVLETVGKLHDCEQVVVRTLSPADQKLVIRQKWRAPAARLGEPATVLDIENVGWPKPQVLRGECVILVRSELPDTAARVRELMAEDGTEVLAIAPMRVENETIGMIGLNWSKRPETLPVGLLGRLKLLAEVVASTLARQRAEAALQERLRFEELLGSLSTRLINGRHSEIDGALSDGLRGVAEFHACDQVLIRRFDAREGALFLLSCWSSPATVVAAPLPRCTPADLHWRGDAALREQYVLLTQKDVPLEHGEFRDQLERARVMARVLLPLQAEGEVLGTIELVWASVPTQCSEALLKRLVMLASVVTNALVRRRSEEQREQAFLELEQLKKAAEQERDYLRKELQDSDARDPIGVDSGLKGVFQLVDAVAPTSATVLVCGESGVGKELVARAIHQRSGRANGPMVKVNCASIPKELFESEFFGHVKGSFTGALRNRAGRFEIADGGTIFLDEVGEIPFEMQSKLLRVLQDGCFERVGDDRTRAVNVRVVAATNRDLEVEVQAGKFRADLYYRLNAFPIAIPPLRERREDIGALAEVVLRRCCDQMRRHDLALSAEQLEMLESYEWPGNVRELEHVIERAVILSQGSSLRLDLALIAAPATKSQPPRIMTESELRRLERENLVAALERTAYRVSGPHGAAELVGLSPSTLRDRMKAHNISR